MVRRRQSRGRKVGAAGRKAVAERPLGRVSEAGRPYLPPAAEEEQKRQKARVIIARFTS